MSFQYSYHSGERAVQNRAGERDMADRNAVVIADTVLTGARPFIAKLGMVALSRLDAQGMLWSSVLYGKAGFLQAADANAIWIDTPAAERDVQDPFWAGLALGSLVGMLFIELGSRRRYRINGSVARITPDRVEVQIAEAFPNCPKFIQRRHLRAVEQASTSVGAAQSGAVLYAPLRALIEQADTLFVASANPDGQLDASHRGGRPGFIQIMDEATVRIPDYPGNSMFNTLGNLSSYPHAGLLIPEFGSDRLLHLSGAATILWEQNDPHGHTGGTGRYWEVKIERWILRNAPQHVEWEFLDASPYNPPVPTPV